MSMLRARMNNQQSQLNQGIQQNTQFSNDQYLQYNGQQQQR